MTLERRTLSKVTWRIIPFLVLCYFLAFVDRINVGIAALTMNRDLGLSPAVFGFGAGLFFVSYFFLEVPSNILMQKVGARRWIARIMISWGIVSGATAFVQGTNSFYAVRLLLGAAEAGFFPAILFYLSSWFPEGARAKVFAYFLAAVPLAGIIGFPISGMFLALDGIWGLKGWQWLFLIEALPTLIVAVVAYYYLTDHPSEATWLSDEQRKWLLDQLAQDERQRKGRARDGNWVNLVDFRVICFATIHFCGNLAIYGLGFFLPQIVKASGFSNFDASLVSALPYVLGAVGMLVWGRYSAGGRARMGVFLPFFIGTIGFVGAATSGDPILMIVSLCVASFGALGYAPGFWTLPTSLLSGTASAIAIAAINSVGNFAGFLGPYTIGYLRETTGSFEMGLFVSAAVMTVAALLVLVATRSNRPAEASVPQDVEVDAVSAPRWAKWSRTMSTAEIDQKALRTLLVKERLHELEMAYCRGVDRRDPELLRSIFFEDAIEEHGVMYRGSAMAFVDWVFSDFIGKYELTTHYVLNEWYRVDGDSAEGETHRISHHRVQHPDLIETIAACRTFNRYECRNGVWKIAYRGVVRDWIYERPFNPALFEGTYAMTLSRPNERDRSYEVLSLFGRGPIDR